MPREEGTDAFGMLKNSHRRLRERLGELEDAMKEPKKEESREIIADVLRFIDRAVARHEADEEASLFPRLKPAKDLADVIRELHEEHEAQAKIVKDLRAAFDAKDIRAMKKAANQLRDGYERHITREEEELFPKAQQLLDTAAREEMLKEMDQRRGR